MIIIVPPVCPSPLDIQLIPLTSTAALGDLLVYQINFQNNASYVLESIIMKVSLSSNLTFLEGSLKLNGIPLYHDHIITGISIPFLAPYESGILSYTLTVSNSSEDTLFTQATALFKYLDPFNHILKNDIVYSERNTISIVTPKLDFSLSCTQTHATLNDVLDYTLTLHNTGSTPLYNVAYLPQFSAASRFVLGSLSLDNRPLTEDLNQGFIFHSIAPHSILHLTYQVLIVSGTVSQSLLDTAKVILNHTPANPSDFITEYIVAMPVVSISILSLKLLSLNKNLSLPLGYPPIDEIDTTSVHITIDDYHVLPSIPTISAERQSLTSYKVIVYAHLDICIEYTSAGPCASLCFVNFKFPFSTFLVLPSDYTLESFQISSLLEFTDVTQISADSLNIFNTLIIYLQFY